jgi:hypothetical protein
MTTVQKRDVRRWLAEQPVVVALVLSLVIHLALFGTWRLGQRFGWWNHHAEWLVKLTQKLTSPRARAAALQPKTTPPRQQEIPLTFLEVDPATAVEKAPEKAKFYSDKNSVASNPEPDTKPTPKIDGEQTKVVRVMDNPKPLPFPLQPEPKPKGGDPGEKPGDLALNTKPRDPKPPSDGTIDTSTGQAPTPRERPRTVSEAKQRLAMLTGEKVKQDGGAERKGRVAFDTKATPFGSYDRAFIEAVETRWHHLLDNNLITPRSGKVACEFKLTYDGRIIDLKIPENEVGEILATLCRNAIEDNQLYPKWPDDMRRMIGAPTREIRFTFYYN